MGNSTSRQFTEGWNIIKRVWYGIGSGSITGMTTLGKAGPMGAVVGAIGGALYGAVKGSVDAVHWQRGQDEARNNPNATSLPAFSPNSYVQYALDGSPMIHDHLGKIAGSEDGAMLNRFAQGVANGENWRSAAQNAGINRWTEANSRGIAQVISRAVVATGQVDPRFQFSLGDTIARSQALAAKRTRSGAASYRQAQRGQGSAILGFADALIRQNMSGGIEGAAFHSSRYAAQAGTGGDDNMTTTFSTVR